MSRAYETGMLFYGQRRWDLALEEFRQALRDDPNDAKALAASTICLIELEDEVGARQAAQLATRVGPEEPESWLAVGRVALHMQRLGAAEIAVNRARRLAPDRPGYHGLAGLIQKARHRWPEALEMAEQGLALDDHDAVCAEVRVHALIKMGRVADAREFLRASVVLDPEHPLSQAERGWTALERRELEESLQAFREALRVDPELEWAREGMAEALGMDRPLYGFLLRYLLRRQRARDERQVMVALGEMLISRVVGRIGRRYERLRLLAAIFMVGRGILMYTTWVARPLANLMLRVHPEGRRCLSDEQRSEALFAGLAVIAVITSLLGGFVAFVPSLVAFVISLIMITVISATYDCHAGWPRQVMGGLAVVLTCIGAYAVAKIAIWPPDWNGWRAFALFVNGTVVADLASYFLRSIRPARPSRRLNREARAPG